MRCCCWGIPFTLQRSIFRHLGSRRPIVWGVFIRWAPFVALRLLCSWSAFVIDEHERILVAVLLLWIKVLIDDYVTEFFTDRKRCDFCCIFRKIHNYHPQTNFATVMFSQVSVCPQGGAVSVQGVSVREISRTETPLPPGRRPPDRDPLDPVRILLECIIVYGKIWNENA